MKKLLAEISKCTICESKLPNGCRPVCTASKKSKIVIVGQAPGIRVHESGIPWDDKSGDNLRRWLGVSKEQFYDPDSFGIIPMGFCYPGTGKSGDLPPRPECAPQWHSLMLEQMKEVKLTLLVGAYAQKYYLKKQAHKTLTKTVMHFENYLPTYFALPHPSPRNNIWMKKNEWFQKDVLPKLSSEVNRILSLD